MYSDILLDSKIPSMKEKNNQNDEKFHCIFISGDRDDLEASKLHVRGLGEEYKNVDEIFVIFLHIKSVRVKETKGIKDRKVLCFSYMYGEKPFHGTDGYICPDTAKERDADQHCQGCKNQLICSGILVDKNGTAKLDAEGKPILVFVRGKGVKLGNITNYLNMLSEREDLTKIDGVSPEVDRALNRSKVVTKITMGGVATQFGKKPAFNLVVAKEIKSQESIKKILKFSEEFLDDFHRKFDWSIKKQKEETAKEDSEIDIEF